MNIINANKNAGLDKLMKSELCKLVHFTGFLFAGKGYSVTNPIIVSAMI
jgi:hypothetical protein